MLHTTKSMQLGNTTYLECTFYNMEGLPTDPTGIPTFTIYKESGAEATSGNLVKRKDGYWGTYYTPSEIGEYSIEYSGVVDSKVALIKSNFKVVSDMRARS